MNCVDLVCGTGGWTGPKPGDPDLGGVTLSAVPGFGGVNVSWSYPNTNPFAVAYTIVYRGNSSSFSSAIEVAKVAGNRYLDPMELNDNGLYYYWIRLISVHGTEGALVGPAECRMRTTIGQIIEDLTGEIREGVLHRALLEKIERIQMLGDGLRAESRAREEDILAVSQTIEGLQVAVDSAVASISTETLVRISTIDALARELTTLNAEFEGRTGQLQQEIGLLITQDEALARAVTVAQVAADEANAAFRTEQQARISADSALANSITTVESQMGNNLAQARQTLQTDINTINGKVTAIGARYTVQVQVNGLAGGFGIYNDGTSIDAGFIADRFWVGNASAKRKPFIIKGGVTYIDQAMIEDASITNAKIANGAITSVKIGDAQITSAKIGTAEVGTLKIAGEAVTVPRGASVSSQACWNSADLCHVYIGEAVTLFVTAGGAVVTRQGSMSSNYAAYPATGSLLKDGNPILTSNSSTRVGHLDGWGGYVPAEAANFSFGTIITGPGSFAIRLASPATFDVYGVYVTVIGCKR
jgi:hypothetical protein